MVRSFRSFLREGAAEQVARVDEAGYIYRVFRGMVRQYLGGQQKMAKPEPSLDSDVIYRIMRSDDNLFDWMYHKGEDRHELYFSVGGFLRREATSASRGVKAGPWREVGILLTNKLTGQPKNAGGDYRFHPGPLGYIRVLIPDEVFKGSTKQIAQKLIRHVSQHSVATIIAHEMAHHLDFTQSSGELTRKPSEYGDIEDPVEWTKYIHVGIEMQARLIQLLDFVLRVIGSLYAVKQNGFLFRFKTFPLFQQFFSKEIEHYLHLSHLDDEGKKYMLGKLYRIWDYLGSLKSHELEKLADDLSSKMYLRRKDRLSDTLEINNPKIYPLSKYTEADGHVWLWLKDGSGGKELFTTGALQRKNGKWTCWNGEIIYDDQIAGWQRFRGITKT